MVEISSSGSGGASAGRPAGATRPREARLLVADALEAAQALTDGGGQEAQAAFTPPERLGRAPLRRPRLTMTS